MTPAALRTIFDFIPTLLPFFTPSKRPLTDRTNFLRQIGFFMRSHPTPSITSVIQFEDIRTLRLIGSPLVMIWES
ncbi:Uncharacterised protein [Vibrio cholerae]|uniref:Uncharacterized protein n=1 Tax=Vibrio cholerae TaxID=666 RepID=A0A655XHQ1_VIBCL|nr:Uncharacterised protein [Vibrio cholerae]CSB65512.1 Uncharacterised protein [Vibrio cholerae]CSC14956.1 Uncharacterised protein [Vibrio cholerae]CSC66512.1 Uncharacterised protein [Vibrio cholerae]CSC85460.1 Uncharacterised protein [Vibrio cholerae]